LFLLAVVSAAPSAFAQAPRAALTAIAHLEDRRPHGAALDSLRGYTAHRDPSVRATAVRVLGRLQRADELPVIYARFRDVPEVQREAVNAVGQALRGAVVAGSPTVVAAVDSLATVGRLRPGDATLAGITARTIGRLPHGDSTNARRAEAAIVSLRGAGLSRLEGQLHGLYALARARRALGNLSADGVRLARAAMATPGATETAARVRRLGMLTVAAAGSATDDDVARAMRDPDEQVRRLAAVTLGTGSESAKVARLTALLSDRSPIVRHEAVRAWRSLAQTEGCAPLIAAIGDRNPHVMLAAIDGLSSSCRDRTRAADTLLNLIDANRSDSPSRAAGRPGWQVHAHALVALARTDAARAVPIVRREAAEATFWGVKAWVARAAQVVRDTVALRQLAGPGHGNPREIALGALASITGHADDDLFLAALDAPEYHVVAEAAQALKGSPAGGRVVDALLRTLERLSAEDRDNNRDPRVALLERIEELADAGTAPRLTRYLVDRDTAVALRAQRVLRRWVPGDHPVERRHRGVAEEVAPLLQGEWRARIVLRASTGGGTMEVRLLSREAPYTVARFVRLARAGHYNGLTLHRVEPGFVIQGGSPAANEYVGDGPFMRDEVGLTSHLRGTFGISTRGRDTGDAQFFVNLTDNFRLDHDYTVFAEIVRGRDVAEGVLEADVIERVEVFPVRR
jgi:peptidyl-prolyl cis-trans isomerase B (cyclophilin B)